MLTNFNETIQQERQTHREAAIVAKLADAHGYSCEYVAQNAELLDPFGLDPDDISPAITLHARRILAGYVRGVESWADARNARIAPVAPTKAVPYAPPSLGVVAPPKPAGKPTLFGFPITAVIRWMGKDDWTFAPTRQVLATLGVVVADSTIHAQLRAGKLGQRGEPATLTEAQANQLYEALDD